MYTPLLGGFLFLASLPLYFQILSRSIYQVVSPSKETPTILAFPTGQIAWRIDWFGSVAFSDRVLRRKQPSIFVYLSQVSNRDFLNDSSLLLDPKSTDSTQNQRGCWVSVGTLPLLQIGNIWQDQKLLLRPDYQLESFW